MTCVSSKAFSIFFSTNDFNANVALIDLIKLASDLTENLLNKISGILAQNHIVLMLVIPFEDLIQVAIPPT